MLPIFSLDNFRVNAGKIKKNNTFKIRLSFNVGFEEASKEIASVNREKYLSHVERLNINNYSGDEYDHGSSDDDSYYDADDDEENIMRGLAGGNGDLFEL